MRVPAASAAPSQRLNEKGALIYQNQSPDKLAEYAPSISHYLFNPNNFRQARTHFLHRENSWAAFPPQSKEPSAFYKDAVLIQHALAMPKPLTVRQRITQSELTLALEVANAPCLKEEKSANALEILPQLSPRPPSISDDIKQKIKELKTKHSDAIESFINRLSTLLDQKDIERLEEPGREFNVRLREIRDEFTRAEWAADLEGIKSATDALDALASDLSTLSTNLYESQAPDVQKIGARLTISMLISGITASCISAGAAFLFLPGVISAITGIIVAVAYGYFKYQHVQQEVACQDKTQEWDQARASIHHVQAEIKSLNTQIQQAEENIMNSITNHINTVTDRVNQVSHEVHTFNDQVSHQVSQMMKTMQQMQQKIEQQDKQIEQLQAKQNDKTGAALDARSEEEMKFSPQLNRA